MSAVVITMMVTNAILGGIADTTAQVITSVRQRAVRKYPSGESPNRRDDPVAFEIHELDRKNPLTGERELIPDSKALPPPFDFERLTRFMAYGFGMAPLQFRWFKFLERCFPITKTSAFGPAMKRVAFDQLIFAPFGIACFFTVMTVAEGGGRRAVYHKLRDMYVPTLKANFMVWPAVQVINFRLMPVQFQLVRLLFCPALAPHCLSPLLCLILLDPANTSSLLLALCFDGRYRRGLPICPSRMRQRRLSHRPDRSPSLPTPTFASSERFF